MLLGVVSSDLGVPGVNGLEGCDALGANGVMNPIAGPEVTGCSPTAYPRFLTCTAGANEVAATANDLACIATLGTDGCRVLLECSSETYSLHEDRTDLDLEGVPAHRAVFERLRAARARADGAAPSAARALARVPRARG